MLAAHQMFPSKEQSHTHLVPIQYRNIAITGKPILLATLMISFMKIVGIAAMMQLKPTATAIICTGKS